MNIVCAAITGCATVLLSKLMLKLSTVGIHTSPVLFLLHRIPVSVEPVASQLTSGSSQDVINSNDASLHPETPNSVSYNMHLHVQYTMYMAMCIHDVC